MEHGTRRDGGSGPCLARVDQWLSMGLKGRASQADCGSASWRDTHPMAYGSALGRRGRSFSGSEVTTGFLTPRALVLIFTRSPDQGNLWRLVVERIPLDDVLLQGEVDPDQFFSDDYSQPCILRPSSLLNHCPHRRDLLWGYTRPNCSSKALPKAKLYYWLESRLRSRSQSRSLSQSWSQSWSQSRSRSRSRSLSWSLSRLRLRLLSQSWSLSWSLSLSLSRSRSLLLSKSLSRSLSLSESTASNVKRALDLVEGSAPDFSADGLFWALAHFGYQFAVWSWFEEQSGDPDLMQCRGLRVGEPLPVRSRAAG